MIRILVLACLLAAVAAQSTYYCGSTSTIMDRDFYLVTRRGPGDLSYPPGLICEVNMSPGIGIMLDIESFSVQTAVLTVTDSSRILFSGSRLPKYQSSMVASSGYLRIRFDSTGDYSGNTGVTMRIRFFDNNRCPPGWTYLYGSCFGTSRVVSGGLNYVDAQKACNSMGANLLHVPSSYSGSFGSFMRLLPVNLRQYYTFIGLTDRATRFRLYWLNGVQQYNSMEVSCASGGRYSSCTSTERCAAFAEKYEPLYSIYMISCHFPRDFACSMPPGGTVSFFTVPNDYTIEPGYTYTVSSGIIWGAVVGSLFVLSLIIGGIYGAVRSGYVHRNPGAANVVVSTGRVTVSTTSTPYPIQHNMQVPNPQTYPSAQGSMYSVPPPPAYNEVHGGAYNNGGYGK